MTAVRAAIVAALVALVVVEHVRARCMRQRMTALEGDVARALDQLGHLQTLESTIVQARRERGTHLRPLR